MESIAHLNPEMANQIEKLRQGHERFRLAIRKIVVRLDLASPSHLDEFDATCADLRSTINQVLEHMRQENEVLVESLDRDVGGEA
jgi:hypothetical protein